MKKHYLIALVVALLVTTGLLGYNYGLQSNESEKSISGLEAELEIAIESDKYYEARYLISELISAERDNPERWIQLGDLEASRANTREALAAWEYAVKLNPNDIGTRFNLAHLYGIVGEDIKAEAQLDAIAEIDPEALEKGPLEYFANQVDPDDLTSEPKALMSLISIRTTIESYFSDNNFSFVGACDQVELERTADLNQYSCSTAIYDYRLSVATKGGKWLCIDGRGAADILTDKPTGVFCPGSNALEQLFPLDHQADR